MCQGEAGRRRRRRQLGRPGRGVPLRERVAGLRCGARRRPARACRATSSTGSRATPDRGPPRTPRSASCDGDEQLEAITVEDTANGEPHGRRRAAVRVHRRRALHRLARRRWPPTSDGFVVTGDDLQLTISTPRRRPPTRAVPARDEPPGRVRGRRRALRLDQARRLGGRRGRDGGAAGAPVSGPAGRALGQPGGVARVNRSRRFGRGRWLPASATAGSARRGHRPA